MAEVPFFTAAAGWSAQSRAGRGRGGRRRHGDGRPGAAPAFAAARPDTVQQGLNALVRSDGVPAALASVKGREGRTLTYTAGVGDLATGSKVPRDGQMRIGSNTKMFTTVIVLQLVSQGKIGLDAPVATYLPGLVRGEARVA